MLKLLRRIFKRKHKPNGNDHEQQDASYTLKRIPVTNKVNEIISNASDDIKGPY